MFISKASCGHYAYKTDLEAYMCFNCTDGLKTIDCVCFDLYISANLLSVYVYSGSELVISREFYGY